MVERRMVRHLSWFLIICCTSVLLLVLRATILSDGIHDRLSTATREFGEPLLEGQDAAGQDPEGVTRYPGSWRVHARVEETANVRLAIVAYRCGSPMQQIRNFYKHAMTSLGWKEAFSGSATLAFSRPVDGALAQLSFANRGAGSVVYAVVQYPKKPLK